MRFCSQCGAETISGAKFCVNCGGPLVSAEPPPRAPTVVFNRTFIVAFALLLLGGITIAVVEIYRQPPKPERLEQQQEASASPGSRANLPPGHPKIEIPAEAKAFIEEIRLDTVKKPGDVAAWNKLGQVALRAALFDDSYARTAADAFARALKIDPDNLPALKGIGDLNYDHRRFDEAIAAYEHYLRKKSDDAEVRTDLGTMLLYTGNPDQAVVQYQKAIATQPDFFEGYYNLGIAYAEQNKDAESRASFEKALSLAPDDKTKSRVQEMLAKLPAAAGAPTAGAPTAGAPTAGSVASKADAGAAEGTSSFAGEIEQMVRSLPIAGPKVKSVQWTSDSHGKVLMQQFPMDQMPPFAKAKFLKDLKDGIDRAKQQHKFDGTVQLDISDADTGRVMESVTD